MKFIRDLWLESKRLTLQLISNLGQDRVTPTLPQNDTAVAQAQRRVQLDEAQQVYIWATPSGDLDVPLAQQVPRSDEPTVPWLLQVIREFLPILRNQLEVRVRRHGDQVGSDWTRLENIESIAAQAQRALEDLPGERADLPNNHAIWMSWQTEHLQGQLKALLSLSQDAAASFRENVAQDSALQAYFDLFASLPLPASAEDFPDDDWFAWMRVAGPNPMLLCGIKKLPENFPLQAQQYQQVMGDTDDLVSALASRRVYLLDYAELALLVDHPGQTDGRTKHLSAPLALFAVSLTDQTLVPVAIQCGQDPSRQPMILRPGPEAPAQEQWSWQMAKTAVQAADGNYHELFVHLARTHLLIEACAIATHRHLAPEHPLNVLLMPHYEGTLFINKQAAGSLIAANGPIDHIFAAQIGFSQKAAAQDRLGMDFYASMLPAQLKARGVEDTDALPYFPYRDDALLLWNALRVWVADYLVVYYADDAAVQGDFELAAWAKDLMGEGKVKGFRPITSRGQLVDVLTMIIFTASAQHAAVNFPQKPLMSFAPAITGACWGAASDPDQPASESNWLTMLPPLAEAAQQLQVLSLLGSVQYRQLGEYRRNSFPYEQTLADPRVIGPGGPLDAFRARLEQVELTIEQRNRQFPRSNDHAWFQYEFLRPSRIPPSINI